MKLIETELPKEYDFCCEAGIKIDRSDICLKDEDTGRYYSVCSNPAQNYFDKQYEEFRRQHDKK